MSTKKKYHSPSGECLKFRWNWRYSTYNRILVAGTILISVWFSGNGKLFTTSSFLGPDWRPSYLTMWPRNRIFVWKRNILRDYFSSRHRDSFEKLCEVVKHGNLGFTTSWCNRPSEVHMTFMWDQTKRAPSNFRKYSVVLWHLLSFEATGRNPKECWKR